MRSRMLSVIAMSLAAPIAVTAAPGETKLVSTRIPGEVPLSASQHPSVSADGRYVAYASYDSDLVTGDTNARSDIFLYDRQAGTTERISVGAAGAQANADSDGPSISADGRYIEFISSASNLVPGDTNERADVFVRDRIAGTTQRVNLSSTGAQGSSNIFNSSISADGRYVSFSSLDTNLVPGDTNGVQDVFVRDLVNGTTERVSLGNGGGQADSPSSGGSLSADGRYVTFENRSANMVANDTNGIDDLFVRDRLTGTTELVSVASNGAQANGLSYSGVLSADGRYVAFASFATTLVPGDTTSEYPDIFVRDRLSGTTERVSVSSAGEQANEVSVGQNSAGGSYAPSISSSGRYVTFYSFSSNLVPNDINVAYDTFLRDRVAGTTTRISDDGDVFWDVHSPATSFSADERYVALRVDGRIVLRDLQTSTASVITQGTSAAGGGSSTAGKSLSANGRYVAYTSPVLSSGGAFNSNVFVRDLQTGAIQPVSFDTGGSKPNASSGIPAISADGRHVSFASSADNLVAGDSNFATDVFVRDLDGGPIELVSVSASGVPGDDDSGESSISADGRFVAFSSSAGNLLAGEINSDPDIFVRDRQSATTERISVSSSGAPGDSRSINPSISSNGRYVAFASDSTNLVSGDTNGFTDVFVRDRTTGTTVRVSVASNGAQGNDSSFVPTISPDGRYVVFNSRAANLASGVTGVTSVYLRDLVSNTTERVSFGPDGQPVVLNGFSPGISSDGRYVTFTAVAVVGCNCSSQVMVRDRQTQTTKLVSVNSAGEAANAESSDPSISADGQRVVFTTLASNLAADDLNARADVYVRDLPVASGAALRINTGGGAFTDSLGQVWSADTGFNTGIVNSTSAAIAGTTDDALYQNQRWDDTPAPELQYSLPVANGTYLVKLHFAEINADRGSNGARVFNVAIEGSPRFTNLDVFREAGAINKALVKSATVTVSDGQLNILFQHVVRSPIINAIEIIAQGPGGGSAGTVIRTNAGGGAYTDAQGHLWSADSNFNIGSVSTSSAAVAGTDDDSLYQSIRWDDTPAPELQYNYTVPNGEYAVRLLFLESNTKTAFAGARTFDVDMEGVQQIDNLDVYAAAGGLNRPLAVSKVVTVTDGQLNIVFRHQVKNPIVSAIEIIGQ